SIPATQLSPSDASSCPSKSKRAQGMPGEQRTHSLACNKKRTRVRTTGTPNDTAFPAQWFTAYTRSPRCPGLIATVVKQNTCFAQLELRVGRAGPTDL